MEWLALALGALVALFALVDVWYLLRMPLAMLYARCLLPTVWDLLEEQSFCGLVLLSDLDCLLHMNNARYLREADVARAVHMTRCGLFRAVRALGGHTVLAASCCRYRRSLRFLERFVVRTRLLGWDERAFYVEQRFVSARDGFVCAVVLVRQHVVGASPDKAVSYLCRRKTNIYPPEIHLKSMDPWISKKMATLEAVCFVFVLIMTLVDMTFLIRQGLHYVYALLWQKPPKDVFESFVVQNLVLTTDLDYLLHMNNARYLREANIATCTFLNRYGLSAALKALGGSIVLSASCSRHRRPLRLLERFDIRTRILGWDDHTFYLEQLFVRHPNGFVVAVVLCQHHVTGTTPAALITFITQKKVESPELPEEVKHWLKYNEASSQRLRAESSLQKNNKEH